MLQVCYIFQKYHQCGGQHVGRHVMRHFLLPHHICLDIPQWSIHQAPSCSMADSIWLQRALSDGSAVLVVPKLQDSQENPGVGGSGFSFLSHRYGQGVRCQLLGRHSGKDLEPPRCIRVGPLLRLGVQSRSDSSPWHPLGHQRHVGGDRDCLRSFIAKLHRMLVGCVDSGCSGVQWIRYLGWPEDLLDIRDERIQVRI